MKKGNYVYGGGKRQRKKNSRLAIFVGICICVFLLLLNFFLRAANADTKDPADPDESQQTQQTDPNTTTDPNADGNTDGGDSDTGDEGSGDTDTSDTGDTDTDTTDTYNPAAEGMPDRGPEPIPDPRKDSRPWNLVLVNPWNFLPETVDIPLEWSRYDCRVDERCLEALNRMLDDCSAAGLTPIVCSSYRTWDTQTSLFNGTVDYYQYTLGMPYEEAKAAAAKETAWPGTSEHQLGLAVDIVDVNYQLLDDAQADTAVQQWLMANCWKYGFILRYPADKVPQTGIIYEPWHYRYVGEEYAKDIYDSGLCLEEWLARN